MTLEEFRRVTVRRIAISKRVVKKKVEKPKPPRDITVRFGVYIKNCTQVFKEGFPPGCIGYQDVNFDDVPDPPSGRFLAAVLEHEQRVVQEFVEVRTSEVSRKPRLKRKRR